MTRPSTTIPLPRHFQLIRRGEDLEISWRWVLVHPIATAFGLLATLSCWVGMVAMPSGRRFQLEEYLVYAVGLLVTLVLSWVELSALLNRTRIRVITRRPISIGTYRDGAPIRVLTIDKGPIPGWPGATLRAEEIEQICCTAAKHRGKVSDYYTYKVHATFAGGRSVELLELDDSPQALFVEQELATALRIGDDRLG